MSVQPVYNVLDELLRRKLLQIPTYQRSYSWEERQRKDLFGDITKLIEDKDHSDRQHFMSTVVCLNRKSRRTIGAQEYEILEVVDGQQRLTTLILILRALSKRLSLGDDSQKEEGRDLQKLLVKADGESFLLDTNHDPLHIFAEYLKAGEVTVLPRTHSDRRLIESIRDCEKFVEGESDPMRLLLIVKNRLGFVFHVLEDEGTVYTVFEALNSRGLEVEPLDKCKCMLMGMASEQARSPSVAKEKIKDLHDIFSAIYKTVGAIRIPGSEILRYSATLQYQKAPGKVLGEEDALDFFRQYCKEEFRKIGEAAKWLQDVTHKIVPLYTNRRLESVTSVTHARLLAVAILLAPKLKGLKHGERRAALDQWEKVTFRIFGMCRKDARFMVGDYTRLAHQIVNQDARVSTFGELKKRLIELGEEYPAERAVEDLRNANCYEGWEDRLRYLLGRYEVSLARSEGKVLKDQQLDEIWAGSLDSTIEHILPQTHTPNWLARAGAKSKELEHHIHRLGNLLLLPPGVNAAASNKDFPEKKAIYSKHKLRMMDPVLKKTDWTLEDINEREIELLEWAKKEFQDEDV